MTSPITVIAARINHLCGQKMRQRDTHVYMRNGSRVEEQRAMPWVEKTGIECRTEEHAAVTISDSRMLWDLH